MHYYLYKYFNYRTNELYNMSAIVIQKAYRQHKIHQIQKRLTIIKNKDTKIKLNKRYDTKMPEEWDYWITQRNIIKNKNNLQNYEIINL